MLAEQQLLTVADFENLPYDGKKYELVEGVVVEMSGPKLRHGLVQAAFSSYLRPFVKTHKLGIVVADAGFVLARNPDTVRRPDVAFISLARLPEPDLDAYSPIAPDLAVEIVSPNDLAGEVAKKISLYLEAGTQIVWIAYPDLKQVIAYGLGAKTGIFGVTDELDGGDVLPGLRIPLSDVFEGI